MCASFNMTLGECVRLSILHWSWNPTETASHIFRLEWVCNESVAHGIKKMHLFSRECTNSVVINEMVIFSFGNDE